MTFTVGETVVYPNHGAAVIEDIETRQIKGEDKLYLVLRIIGQNDLVVRVPACNLDLVEHHLGTLLGDVLGKGQFGHEDGTGLGEHTFLAG